jgi:diguanylate cyclase (GGDEF)-like protein
MTSLPPKASRAFPSALCDRWQQVQESISGITGFPLVTFDQAGRTVGHGSLAAPLCDLLHTSDRLRESCRNFCDAKRQEAMRSDRVLHFRCHAGLSGFAAPVRSADGPVGVVIGGRALIGSPEMGQLRRLAAECGLPEEALLRAVGALSMGSENALAQTARMVACTAEAVFTGWEGQQRLARKLNRVGNTFSLLTELSQPMERHEIFAMVLSSLAILFDIPAAAVITGTRERLIMRYAFGPGTEQVLGRELSRMDEFIEGFRRDPAPIETDDLHQILGTGLPEWVRSLTLFPMFAGEELTGLIAVFNHPMDEDERRAVSQLTQQVSVALQNADLRRGLIDKTAAIDAITRLNEKLSGSVEMDTLLSAFFDEATRLARAERASLMLLNRKSRELLVKLVKGDEGRILGNCAIPMDEGLAGQVADLGEPLLVEDLESDDRVGRLNRPRYRTHSFVILPLKVKGRTIGVLNVADKISGEVFTPEDLDMLRSLSAHASVALEKSELWEQSKELKRISITDDLTGLLNRRYFQERAMEEIERSRRYREPLAMTMIDVDGFKGYNDEWGHAEGDTVLVRVGAELRRGSRAVDIVARYGGDEFAILSPATDREQAQQLVERIRLAIADGAVDGSLRPGQGALSISAGVASFPEDAGTLEELVNAADKALFRAKREGRNRVTLHDGTETRPPAP